jgi:AcrR family transcriptional regulator
MARRSSFTDHEIFRCVAQQFAFRGRFTIDELTAETGLSMGSIYHRFGSRDGLLAEAWLSAVERFQTVFLEALAPQTLASALDAALATPNFCRSHHGEAVLLACCRRSEFLLPDTPADLRLRIETVNLAAERAMRDLAAAIRRPLLACHLALVAYPLGAVRLYLPSRPVPRTLNAEIAKAVRAALAIEHRLGKGRR